MWARPCSSADAIQSFLVLTMSSMGEIEAGYIHPGTHHGLKGLQGVTGRTNGGDNLGFTEVVILMHLEQIFLFDVFDYRYAAPYFKPFIRFFTETLLTSKPSLACWLPIKKVRWPLIIPEMSELLPAMSWQNTAGR